MGLDETCLREDVQVEAKEWTGHLGGGKSEKQICQSRDSICGFLQTDLFAWEIEVKPGCST